MSELPRALQPWAEELVGIAPHTATALAPWMPRLAAFVGPMRARVRRGNGPLDGYEGIDRRGPYDRLLLSEWLLASELPDEFTRRAAMGEHLFLAPARREPSGARRSVVLFDAGPEQIGPCRLVHIALLALLARRAADEGLVLEWGLVHDPESLRPVSLPRDLDRLCRRRTLEPPSTAWGELLRDVDDGWLVGAPGCESLASELGLRPLVVEERDEGDALTAATPTTHAPPVQLPLADRAMAALLLRDPLAAIQATPPAPERKEGLDPRIFLANHAGQHVLVGYNGVVNVPVSGRSKRPKALWVPRDQVLVAVGLHQKQLCGLALRGDKLQLHGFSRSPRWNGLPRELHVDEPELLRPDPEAPPVPLYVDAESNHPRVTFCTPGGHGWTAFVRDGVLSRLPHRIDAMAWGPHGPRWLDADTGIIHGTGGEGRTLEVGKLDALDTLFGRGGWLGADKTKAFAGTPASALARRYHEAGRTSWRIQRIGMWTGEGGEPFEIPDPGGVLGVVLLPGFDTEPSLVSLRGRSLWVRHRRGQHEIPIGVEPLAAILLPASPEVALLVEPGAVRIVPLEAKGAGTDRTMPVRSPW
ncbi:MAG: hypothetical protein EP330_25070 [Deltaproteobacteria bacterium]|nr:MAG: hypothetical protein EP330_25070 [Deltaproteobacteria bacterium]